MSFYNLLYTMISKLNKSIKIEEQSLDTTEKAQARFNINAASKNDVYKQNLLDNSDFTNPVNQRGGTAYINAYNIDRWHTSTNINGYAYVKDGYIEVTAPNSTSIHEYTDFYQNFVSRDAMTGKTYTMAANINGNVYCTTFTFCECGGGISLTDNIRFYSVPNLEYLLRIYDTTQLYWAALYEGEYTLDTLPEYRPKGYVAELEECQRYYREFHNRIAIGYAYDSNCMCFTLPVNPPMRIDTPTVTLSNGWVLHRGLQTSTYLHEVWVSKGIIAFDMRPSDGSSPFTVNSSGLSFGDLYISADL